MLDALHDKDHTIEVDSIANLKLAAAMKQLGVYVKLVRFRAWKSSITKEEPLEEYILLVPKQNCPNLDKDEEVGPWIISPDDVVGNIDKSMWWFVDEGVAFLRPKMGKGVKHWRTALRHVQTSCPSNAIADESGLLAGPSRPGGEKSP